MTVAIALQVHDGVVLASDSAGTVNVPGIGMQNDIFNVYNNANKIFNLIKGFPLGGVTYGMGNFGSSSISTLIKDLRRRFAGEDLNFDNWKVDRNNYTVKEIAERTREFLYNENFLPLGIVSQGLQFGFMVAGYSSGAQLSEVWSIEIKDGQCLDPILALPQGDANLRVGGDPDVFCRLANGYSPALEQVLNGLGFDNHAVANAMPAIGAALGVPLVVAPMPIRDAVDLAEFFVETTATFAKFKAGAATVGGPVESVAITKHEGFKWVRRKHYFDAVLNPGGA